MDKDQILQMSRNEHKGLPDERELSIEKQAARIGKAVGIAVCLLLVLLAECVLHNRLIAQGAWVVFFSIEGSSDLYTYLKTRKLSRLIWAILKLFCAITYTVIIILNAVM